MTTANTTNTRRRITTGTWMRANTTSVPSPPKLLTLSERPFEVTSAKPSSADSVPSVVISGLMPTTVTR